MFSKWDSKISLNNGTKGRPISNYKPKFPIKFDLTEDSVRPTYW